MLRSMFQAGARRFEDDTHHNDLNLHMASPSRFLIDSPDFPTMPGSNLITKPLSDRELEFLLVRVKIEFRPKSFDHFLWILIDSINEFFASIKQATHRCITT